MRVESPATPRAVAVTPALHPLSPALRLARAVAMAATEKKALDVMIIDTAPRSDAVGYDFIVLASGESEPQLRALVDAVEEKVKASGGRIRSLEASADWVLLDLGDVIAHFFTPERRRQYDLEQLWHAAARPALVG